MNIFVALLEKRPLSQPRVTQDIFSRYLPAAPQKETSWRSVDNQVFFFSSAVGPAGQHGIHTGGEIACVVDGILLPRAGTFESDEISSWLLRHFGEAKSAGDLAVEGEYALAWSNAHGMFCHSNIGGSHNIYYAVTEHFVAISNRSACLLALPGVSHDLDPEAIAWKALHGFVSQGRTAFGAIRKIPNGSFVSIQRDGAIDIQSPGYQDLVKEDIREAYAKNPVETFYSEIDNIAQYIRRGHTSLGSQDIDLPLSGGKDSRVILALLKHAGLSSKICSIWTRGPMYSPEVLAAQDICKRFNFDSHEIRRPPLASQSIVRARTIVNSLNLHEGLLSLYDFCGIEKRNTMRFQGHELGLRAGRFAKCDTSSLEAFVASALKTFSNPLQILRDPTALLQKLELLFRSFYEMGCPIGSLGDIYSTFDRLPSWAAVMSAVDYCGGHISNPLLHGDVVKFSFNIPSELARSEVFHYLTLQRAAPELLTISFAEQVWPNTLPEELVKMGIDTNIPTPVPYRSEATFPNVRNPYVANVKLEYFNALKPVVNDFLQKHKALFSNIIDIKQFIQRQNETFEPQFVYLYAALGVYSAAILAEYGSAIFDRTRLDEIAADLQSRIDAAALKSASGEPKIDNDIWADVIKRHEVSIAALVRSIQEFRQQQHLKS